MKRMTATKDRFCTRINTKKCKDLTLKMKMIIIVESIKVTQQVNFFIEICIKLKAID